MKEKYSSFLIILNNISLYQYYTFEIFQLIIIILKKKKKKKLKYLYLYNNFIKDSTYYYINSKKERKKFTYLYGFQYCCTSR